jgi:hypothetical protein
MTQISAQGVRLILSCELAAGPRLTRGDAPAAAGPAEQPTDEAFLAEIYRSVLGDTPDLDGFRYWLGVLAIGEPRWKVANTFRGGSGTQPEAAGQPAAADLTDLAGLPPEEFVRGACLRIFGREADAATLRHYCALLACGVDRGEVAAALAHSPGAIPGRVFFQGGAPLPPPGRLRRLPEGNMMIWKLT